MNFSGLYTEFTGLNMNFSGLYTGLTGLNIDFNWFTGS